MWPIILIGAVGYALYQAFGSGNESVAQLLTDLQNEGGLFTTVSNDVSSGIASGEDDVEDLIGDVMPVNAQQIMDAESAYDDVITAGAQGWEKSLIIGLGWQESNLGTSSYLDMPGPGGTGDFTARSPSWVATYWPNAGGNVVQVSVLPAGWHGTGAGPWMIPADGRGWGRGLWQIDWPNAVSINWPDPATNLAAAVKNLNTGEAYFQKSFPAIAEDDLVTAVVTAYNHGYGKAPSSTSAGYGAMLALYNGASPDTAYSDDVFRYANAVAPITDNASSSPQGANV